MEQFFSDYLVLLHNLHTEFIATFDGLPPESLDWVPGADMNSLVVLVVHTTGASRFWAGDVALGEDSHRDRAAEFQARGLSAVELKARFEALEAYLASGFERLSLADLAQIRAVPGRDYERSVGACLLHVIDHTGVHLGHAQITHQLWQQRAT